MKTTDQLVFEVRKKFAESRPNGVVLEWDENRFFLPLKELFENCKVVNCTDFNYSYCNSYEIEPIPQPQEYDYVLTFKTSFVLDVYSLHIARYSKDRKSGQVVKDDEYAALLPTISKVRLFAERQGFQEVNGRDQDVIVDGVSLELSGVATLGKCLFDDFE